MHLLFELFCAFLGCCFLLHLKAFELCLALILLLGNSETFEFFSTQICCTHLHVRVVRVSLIGVFALVVSEQLLQHSRHFIVVFSSAFAWFHTCRSVRRWLLCGWWTL